MIPARIYMWSSHRIELEKSDVQLFCRADGDPQPSITWIGHNDVAIKNDSKQYEVRAAHITCEILTTVV